MDILTLSLAVQKTLRELGIDKKTTALTYDGQSEDLIDIEGITYTKVSGEKHDLNDIVSAETRGNNGVVVRITAEMIEVNNTDYGQAAISDGDSVPFAIYSDEFGLLVLSFPGGYTSRLEFETIHPIDPKFLPGVCLPVVELEDTGESSMTITDEKTITALNTYSESALAILVKLLMGDIFQTVVMVRVNNGITNGFSIFGTGKGIVRTEDGSGWVLYM